MFFKDIFRVSHGSVSRWDSVTVATWRAKIMKDAKKGCVAAQLCLTPGEA